jgi:hypothetical protein
MHPALTVQAVLHHRQREDGTHRVQVRLTLDRKSVFMDAGFTLPEKHWNEKGHLGEPKWVRRSEKDYERLNNHLWDTLYRAKEVSEAYPHYTAAEVRDYLLLPTDESSADLKRKAKQANTVRESLSKSPIVVRRYQMLVKQMEHMRRELEAVKADLAKLKAAQRGAGAN